jgi:hypothetical protein
MSTPSSNYNKNFEAMELTEHGETQEERIDALTLSFSNYLDSKAKVTALLKPYIRNGTIDFTKHPELHIVKTRFFELYVRSKYNGTPDILGAAEKALDLQRTSSQFTDALVEMVCNNSTKEAESGSARHTVQTAIRRAFNACFNRMLKDAEEHYTQAECLRQVRLLPL